MKTTSHQIAFRRLTRMIAVLGPLCVVALQGCGQTQKQNKDFYTSGSSEADERAEQRMAKTAQLTGGAESTQAKVAQTPTKHSLYERLGSEDGLTKIADDFVTRAMADPRVNFNRKGVIHGGINIHREKSMEWKPTAENVSSLKLHLVQFLSVATGGPSKYDGRDMKSTHADMHISNAEFDAAVGDLKATLDKLQIANTEQKELLAVLETTRAQIVEER